MGKVMKCHTQFEDKVLQSISQPLLEVGYEVVRVRSYMSQGQKRKTQIMIDRLDCNPVTISDCENANKVAGSVLSESGICGEKDLIEMSSPGLDRPLTSLKDMEKHSGCYVKIATKNPIGGRKKFSGKIREIVEDNIMLVSDEQEIFNLKYSSIMDCSLDYFKSTNEVPRMAKQ